MEQGEPRGSSVQCPVVHGSSCLSFSAQPALTRFRADNARGPESSHIAALSSANLRERVRRALEAAIVAGELQPGALYSAPVLGVRFGVSATPVREAMLELARDGFVVAERNRGFRVVEVAERDLDEISKIRLLLEVPSTVEVAEVIEPDRLDHLSKIASEIFLAAGEGQLIAYLDLDRSFHVELISRLGNDRLTDLVDRLRRQTRLFGLDQLVESGRLHESAQEHHDLIAAMRARDTAATESIITSHIKHTRGLWVGREET
ncbi:MAG: GntR family transcriptional regulator [Actinobacteria bacterium]|nr:GntR family transcriptional regulator [Actinomycetota bacterium]